MAVAPSGKRCRTGSLGGLIAWDWEDFCREIGDGVVISYHAFFTLVRGQDKRRDLWTDRWTVVERKRALLAFGRRTCNVMTAIREESGERARLVHTSSI